MEEIATNGELKARALDQLRGNWTAAVLVTLITIVLTSLVNKIPEVGGLLQLLIEGQLALGAAYFYLRLRRGESATIADMFEGFSHYVPSLVLYLLYVLFVLLWSLLLIIPGIVAALGYSMAFYIRLEHPELTAMETLSRSKELMRGHKWRLFVLQLSFIGWGLLCILTLGIGLLWLSPYMQQTIVNFYTNLKNSQGPVG